MSGRLRIAVLGTRGIPGVMGGVETHCEALYPRLAAKGHSVTLFARKGYVEDTPYSYQGIRIEPLWSPRKKSLEAICHTAVGVLKVAVHRQRFDLLHIHAIGPSLLTPVARLLGLKVVMTHHGPDYDRQKWGRLAKSALRLGERLGCRHANAVITVSRHIRSCVSSLYQREAVYIPNGVVLPGILAPGTALERCGLLPRKYILAVGRFVPEKGFHDLVDAFAMLGTDWKLVVAGDADHPGEYSRSLKERAARDSRVVLTGFIKGGELAEIYSNAGLFVLPSYHEGLPIALLEAMSYNLPLLASDIPANRELAEEDELFPVGDIRTIANRLSQFLAEPHPAADKRGRIAAEFNWDRVAEMTEKVYMML